MLALQSYLLTEFEATTTTFLALIFMKCSVDKLAMKGHKFESQLWIDTFAAFPYDEKKTDKLFQ